MNGPGSGDPPGGDPPQPPLEISPTSLSNGQASIYYSVTFSANGRPPFEWSTSGGTPGLDIDSNGVLSGVPQTEGTYNFEVRAQNSSGISGSTSVQLIITPPPEEPPSCQCGRALCDCTEADACTNGTQCNDDDSKCPCGCDDNEE